MYGLPARFHVGMMAPDAANATPSALPAWPPSSGGVKRQHSVEYWMMASLQDGSARGGEAVRVRDPDAADAFFSSLSFNVHGRNMTDPDTEADRLLQVPGISQFPFRFYCP
jgi:putative arabinosyltransferase